MFKIGISDMKDSLSLIDERATLRILIILLEKDKNLTSLVKEIDGAGLNAINNAINGLLDLNLIKEADLPFNIRLFSLTDKGKEVAEIVLELKKKIEEEV